MFHVKKTVPGPTYAEMLHPELPIRAADELDPINLFNITWRGPDHRVRHILLPKELTGVHANIVVLVGRNFPSGSHKVGAADVAHLKGYPATVIMPEGMSKERYARIRQYGGELDLTPGSESDVILVLERTEHY